MTNLSRSQLWQIVRALEGLPRNPNIKATALKIIEIRAGTIGRTVDDILSASDGLLDGSMNAEDFRKEIFDHAETVDPLYQESAGVNVGTVEVDDIRSEVSQIRAHVETIQNDIAELMSKPVSRMKRPTRPSNGTKTAKIIEMLRRPQGSTIHELSEMTGWKTQSVHSVMSSTLRKRLGLDISSMQRKSGRHYYLSAK